MKYTATAISLLTLLSTSAAQSIADVPQCASGPALEAITSSGCPLTDAGCICRNEGFINGLRPKIEAACPPEDLQRTTEFTARFCGAVGVDLAATTSASPTASSTMAAPSATGSNGSMMPGNSTAGGAPTSPDPSPQPAPESGVAGLVGLAKHAGALGVVVAGVAMLL